MGEEKKRYRWARKLNSRWVSRIIQELNPKDVEFIIKHPKHVVCTIETEKGKLGEGLAICSTKDTFNPIVGKNISLVRAYWAIQNQKNSNPVRKSFEQCPKSWTRRQIERVTSYGGHHKSTFIG